MERVQLVAAAKMLGIHTSRKSDERIIREVEAKLASLNLAINIPKVSVEEEASKPDVKEEVVVMSVKVGDLPKGRFLGLNPITREPLYS